MAKTRFRNLFRGAGSGRREAEAPIAAQPPGGGAKQPRLFAETAATAESVPQAVAPEVPATVLDTSPPLSDASPDLVEAAPSPASELATAGERSLAEYLGAAVQLRDSGRFEETETLLNEAVDRFPAEPRPRVEWALLAHARRDWAEAVRRWQLVRDNFPNEAVAHALGAVGLRELGRYDEAQSLLAAARESFPDDLGIANENAWLATHRRDWAEALRRWGRIRKQFPDQPAGYTGMAMIQRELRWFDEADAMLTDAVERFPTQPGPSIDYARLAEARGHWPEASARWDAVRESFPDHPAGYVSGAAALRELGRLDEAEALLAEAVTRFPNDAGVAIGHAVAAHRRRDWEETVRRCETLRAAFPLEAIGYTLAGAALRELGRNDEAEPLLASASARFRADIGIATEYALIAVAKREWARAAERWDEVCRRDPNQLGAALHQAMALRELGRYDDAEALLRQAAAKFPEAVQPLIELARAAEARQDWEEALARWREARARFADESVTYIGEAAALRRIGRGQESEPLLLMAAERLPHDPAPLADWALIAHGRRDWEEALKRWDSVHANFPDHRNAYVFGAAALRELGRLGEAEALLRSAIGRFSPELGLLLEHARIADVRREWPEALRRWDIVREHFPDQAAGYVSGAVSLHQLGRIDEAEDLLKTACERFPDDLGAAIEYAWMAHRRRDWQETAQRWKAVRTRFPQQLVGYTGAAVSLRESLQLDEAEALMVEAEQRFAHDPAPPIEMAMIAHIRRDLTTAVARWQRLRERFPTEVVPYTMGALDLFNLHRDEEAEAVLRDGIDRLADASDPLIQYARMAERRRKWPAAIERWEQVRERLPQRVEGYTGGAFALSSADRDAEAEQLLEQATALFPDIPHVACEHAWLAYRQHRWEDAEQRFATIRERFPEEPAGYRGGAAVLVSCGAIEQAESMLEQGMTSIPSDPFLPLEHARIPTSPLRNPERDWDTAISRLEALCAQFPDFEHGHIELVRMLRDRGRIHEAEAVASRAFERRARTPDLVIEYGKVAQQRGDWPEALRRYRLLTERFPDHSAGLLCQAEALLHLGQFDEAEALLEQAKASFPEEPTVYAEHARLAAHRGQTQEALRRWTEAERRFPDDPVLAQQIFVGRLRATEDDPAAASAVERTVSDANAELACAFESLGGTALGCEFGLFQRDLGAEPLGLLRWTDMEPDDLIAALEAGFDGVGLPENTELITPADSADEYGTRDQRFGMRMHTFVSKREVPADKMFAQVCRRLQFLRDKLLADLEGGQKIFVYKITARNLTDEELRQIHAAVRRYGDNTLLYVRYSDPEHSPGTVEFAKPGLLIGYIDRFAMSPSGQPIGAQTIAWTELCRKAYQLWKSGAVGSTAEPSTEAATRLVDATA